MKTSTVFVLFVPFVVTIIGVMSLGSAERTMLPSEGWLYWGAQPGGGPGSTDIEILDEACCRFETKCDDNQQTCGNISDPICRLGEGKAYVKYPVAKRDKCTAGFGPTRTCSQPTDEGEHSWNTCALYTRCVFDDVLNDCVNDTSEGSEEPVKVPPDCTDNCP